GRTLVVLQFLLAVYGGYFGGAVGLLMLAVWTVFGVSDVRAMNAARILLVVVMNSVAVATFAVAGKVFWLQALTMGIASVTGGYLGARVGRRLDPSKLRVLISCFNVAITAAFFWRAFQR
ncbi:MAG: sulfite exporter TauE/SafE family protein, partial [Myxococcales bacterium]